MSEATPTIATQPNVPSVPLGQTQTPATSLDPEVAQAFAKLNLPETEKFSDSLKNTLYYGLDPTNPLRFGQGNKFQKGEALSWAIEEMLRADCPEETIYKLLTESSFSLAVTDCGKDSKSDVYLRKMITRARDWAFNDATALINREYFALLEGGRTTYYREAADGKIFPMNKESFEFETAPIKVEHLSQDAKGNPKNITVEASRLWKGDSRRRYYHGGFVLDPSHSERPDQYNLWKGFAIPPTPGDWSRMRRHILEVLANGNVDYAKYIVRWLAWKLKNPATPPRTAIVFVGEEGTGKGIYCREPLRIYGPQHSMHLSSMEQIAGRFNAHHRACCYAFADEIGLVNDENEGNLKRLITEPTLMIEGKGKDLFSAPNHIGMMMSTNRDHFLKADKSSRRYAIFEVSDEFKDDNAYWDALYHEISHGGTEAMLHDMLAYNLEDWHPDANRPDTAALNAQKVKSLPPMQQAWVEILSSGCLPCGFIDEKQQLIFLPSEELIEKINQKRSYKEPVTSTALGHLLGKLDNKKEVNKRPRGWWVPGLASARQQWNERFKVIIEWDEAKEWQVKESVKPMDDKTVPF